MTGNSQLGRITVSPRAISSIASRAALQSYGVVGLTAKNLFDGIAHALVRDPAHGVEVRSYEDCIVIDLYVVIEYGTRVSSVATSVANAVRYQVERIIGTPVAAVNVHVQDLRVSDTD
ncbi:MAG TPA: Asp23/Gls24 family envelope stress response protein [Anaerolineae bacterium]|nr:Asp23/Gls24 family envelope stress response protein [Anaerolineae bacterium]